MSYLLIYIVIINIIGSLLMRADKIKARKNEWRIPEARLWFVAFIGGAFGIYVGMKRYRHKTKHALFKYGVPFIWMINLIFYQWLYQTILQFIPGANIFGPS